MLLESAIRVCYNSFDKCDGTIECARNIIKKIIENWHLDTLEHASATYSIRCSRSAMAQITRHRLASFGVESQRYVRYDEPSFIDIQHQSEGTTLYEEFMNIAHETYTQLIENYGWKKEDARYVLPEAWVTNMTVTMNFRAWRHFLELRLEKSAQWEIRGIARSILKDLYKEAPSCFEDLAIKYKIGR
jgi:thymidylate synthase (FAD)